MGAIAPTPSLLAAVAALTLASPSRAADVVAPTPAAAPIAAPEPAATAAEPDSQAATETLELTPDSSRRLTLSVMVDGKGPYAFLVDTGSDRTTISRELAGALALPQGRTVLVHGSAGADLEHTVLIDRLAIGGRTLRRIEAPALSARDLGADGMLGVDALRNLHLVMDFKAMQMSSSASHAEPTEPNTIIVRGVNRYGQLILTHSKIHGVPVLVVVDSGSELSIGNPALMRLLVPKEPGGPARRSVELLSATGQRMAVELADIAEADVGGVIIHNMPMGFGQLHTFERFGLIRQPAMLLGMDVLRQCQKVSVDLRRREATFTLN